MGYFQPNLLEANSHIIVLANTYGILELYRSIVKYPVIDLTFSTKRIKPAIVDFIFAKNNQLKVFSQTKSA
jgi:hypothetical protein